MHLYILCAYANINNNLFFLCLFFIELTEEWALATSMKEFAVHSDDTDADSDEPEVFSVKYLGNTIIDAARSEEATADAVKSVISLGKSKSIMKTVQSR